MARTKNATLDASVPGRTPAQIAYTKRRREAAKAAGIVPPPQARRKFLLPANDWKPREYQLPTWRALQSGIKRVVSVWHRRAGKDDVALHWTACSAFRRPGVYWHMLPQAAQARKAIWSAVNPHTGKRRIDEAFPLDIRKSTRENEMSIEFANGALWQVVGSDNYNSLVGSPPVGVTFSEWALADPNAWTYLRPILAENGGWAWFVYTPRGQNHAAKFYANAKTDPTWYAELLRARDTGVFTAEQLAQELRELQRDLGSAEGQARFDQEYDCDFSSSVPGAYYGEAMTAVDREGRATAVPLTPGVPVHTAWDLGYGDQMFVWLFQVVGFSYRFLKVIYNSSKGIDYYVGEMQKWSAGKPVVWGTHLWPHDGGHGNIATGATYAKTAVDLGLNPLVILDRTQNIDVDINVARQSLASCWFDADGCEFGLNALRNYGREWDDEKKVFANKPRHDWASHPADAFRTFAVGRHRLRSALNGPQRVGMSSHDMAARMPSIGVA